MVVRKSAKRNTHTHTHGSLTCIAEVNVLFQLFQSNTSLLATFKITIHILAYVKCNINSSDLVLDSRTFFLPVSEHLLRRHQLNRYSTYAVYVLWCLKWTCIRIYISNVCGTVCVSCGGYHYIFYIYPRQKLFNELMIYRFGR